MSQNQVIRQQLEDEYETEDMFKSAKIEEQLKKHKKIKSYKKFKEQRKFKRSRMKTLEKLSTLHHLIHKSERWRYNQREWSSNKRTSTHVYALSTTKSRRNNK